MIGIRTFGAVFDAREREHELFKYYKDYKSMQFNSDIYEASEYAPDHSARERALQLLADVKKREEGSKVVRLDKRTLVVRNERRMDEDLRKETEKKPRKKTVVVTTNRHKPSVCAEQDKKKPNRTKAKPIRAKISMEAIMRKTGTIQRKSVGITFIDFCAAEIAELRRMGENTTAERYEKILRINRDLFEGIDIGLLDYTHILAAQEAMVHRGLSANSIGMYNRNLRTMYNRAVARGIVEDASPWKRATTAVAKTKSRALSDTQFKALLAINMDEFYKWGGVEKDTTRKGYKQAYDLFILSFLLRGISPADLASLTPSNFRNGTLTYARKKTHQVLSMKVPEKAKKIIRKYKADGGRGLLGVSLNRIRQLNSFLTKIGEYIGFSEPLTFYCARHTWASLSNAAEVPLTVISKGMGHTDIKTTQIYLASIQTDVVDRYSEKLYTKYGL